MLSQQLAGEPLASDLYAASSRATADRSTNTFRIALKHAVPSAAVEELRRELEVLPEVVGVDEV
jgi:hypothetical protein